MQKGINAKKKMQKDREVYIELLVYRIISVLNNNYFLK